MTKLLLCTLYAVVVMVIVSLSLTYNITYKLFGKMLGSMGQMSYGTGMSFNQPGFLLHIVVFALLIYVPMYFYKD
jgi:hypothetical protein